MKVFIISLILSSSFSFAQIQKPLAEHVYGCYGDAPINFGRGIIDRKIVLFRAGVEFHNPLSFFSEQKYEMDKVIVLLGQKGGVTSIRLNEEYADSTSILVAQDGRHNPFNKAVIQLVNSIPQAQVMSRGVEDAEGLSHAVLKCTEDKQIIAVKIEEIARLKPF